MFDFSPTATILVNIVMATSIHIPPVLLEAVDRKARALKISRNRWIVRALEKELTTSEWSSGFFEQLAAADSETVAAMDEMLASIRSARSSKKPLDL